MIFPDRVFGRPGAFCKRKYHQKNLEEKKSNLDIVRHRERSNLGPYQCNEFCLGGGREGGAIIHGDKAVESLPLHRVGNWNHSSLSNILVFNQHRFNLVNNYIKRHKEDYLAYKWYTIGLYFISTNLGCGHKMSRAVEHVVNPAGDPEIAVSIALGTIPRHVVAREAGEIGLLKPFI